MLVIAPGIANASEMAGVGLAFSLPVTGLLVVIALIVSVMSSTSSGFKYIYACAGIVVLIALIMVSYDWELADDVVLYRWHLFLTISMVIPPMVLKRRLRHAIDT